MTVVEADIKAKKLFPQLGERRLQCTPKEDQSREEGGMRCTFPLYGWALRNVSGSCGIFLFFFAGRIIPTLSKRRKLSNAPLCCLSVISAWLFQWRLS